MAITNAQQYKQLLAKGGRIGLKGGADASQFTVKREKQITPNVTPGGASFNKMEPGPTKEQRRNEAIKMQGGNADINKFIETRNYPKIKLGLFDILTDGKATKRFVDFSSAINRPYFINEVIRAGRIPGLNYGTLADMSQDELEDAYQKYDRARLRGEIDAFGNPIVTYGKDQGEYSDNIMSENEKRLLALEEAVAGKPEVEDDQINYRLLADGGRAGMMDGGMMDDDPTGGIMDLESGRQMYFLGKLVKKATRGIKKLVKSPIGKAALGIAALQFAPGIGDFLKNKAIDFGLFEAGKGSFLKGITDRGKLFGAGLLTLSPFLMGDQDDTDQEQMYKGADLPYPVDYYLSGKYGMNRRLVADGGIMRANYQEGGDAEPVAKKTMPLLDMDGQEKDYRETGGFVDMGRMERADDVPARLSKNEFVFTADAVRNAGEGDIDKGAEVMYNMMKNLESGGEVSEESQGLDGAKEMFKTSQRLEEVL